MLQKETKPYTTERSRAWRNMMIAAVNAGLEQGLFTLHPDGNKWPHADEDTHPEDTKNRGAIYRFEFGPVIAPAIAWVGDAGWGELSIHVALWPTQDAERWIVVGNGGFTVGEAFASGWLERRKGAWLQFNGAPILQCRRVLLQSVAASPIDPVGYKDHGPLMM